MSHPNETDFPFYAMEFYNTAAYPCSYLPERLSVSQVATPPQLITTDAYSELVRHGFRRSGLFTYRPHCPDCHACVPVRVPVDYFQPDRSQRRCVKANTALVAHERPLMFIDEHYALYRRYQSRRHAGGGMDQDDSEQYENFLLQSTVDTRLIEFTENGVLRMVSVIDVLDDGLSSVYTFFDPDAASAGLGTYNVLWQIDQCRVNRLPYLYLGYWIKESRKMAYKTRFRPTEGLINGEWRTLNF
ncbi:arginyltransferase [Propionivibrio limicola]|uniref:arginyltransferase n=1 Tax=Propionivibrio limicola TaxID=167645 RepID=UPI00129112A5|nr:arginyltransferase [Propionivibrio limicola]